MVRLATAHRQSSAMASPEEQAELEQLRALIGKSPERGSTLHMSTFKRYQHESENRKRAEGLRKEKEERARQKEEMLARRNQHAGGLRDAARAQREGNRQVVERDKQKKLAQGQATRAIEAAWQVEREQRADLQKQKGLKLVQATRDMQKRMDKEEADQDKREAAEGTAARRAVEAAFKAEREEILMQKRAKVKRVKDETDPSRAGGAVEWASLRRAEQAAAERAAKRELMAERRRLRQQHLNDAGQKKQAARAVVEAAKQVRADILANKQSAAGKERANDYLVQQEKLRRLADNKQEHAEVYAKKYASAEQLKEWEECAPIKQLAGSRAGF